jgi:hypothetical protein
MFGRSSLRAVCPPSVHEVDVTALSSVIIPAIQAAVARRGHGLTMYNNTDANLAWRDPAGTVCFRSVYGLDVNRLSSVITPAIQAAGEKDQRRVRQVFRFAGEELRSFFQVG